MTDIQARVRAQLRARLKASGAAEFADDQLFTDVDAIFRQALSNDDQGALILPALLPEDWHPELSLRLASHRGGLGSVIVFIKRRILLPLTRWLFEFTLENFRRQHRTNHPPPHVFDGSSTHRKPPENRSVVEHCKDSRPQPQDAGC